MPGRTTCILAAALAAWLSLGTMDLAAQSGQKPGRFAGGGIVVGLEYAVLDNERLVRTLAAAFAETGMPGMKHFPEAVSWGKMQSGPKRPIDFTRLDWFVRNFQDQGFTELTLALKPHSRWGSKDVRLLKVKNASPNPKHRDKFENWVYQVVERYDGDGKDDMPGLRWPIRYVEIGTEFSSYQPEPVGEYLETLAIAYRAAHRAYPEVQVAHVAFLTTPVDMNVGNPADYERVWAQTKRHDTHHGLADMRAVLDRPDIFDLVNLHNLGDPYEIEDQMRWLKYEMGRRGYVKPVIISDTLPTSYIGWGPATRCKGRKLGLLGRPATEADRCRLTGYFKKLVAGDPTTLAWTRGFVAADHVQRTVIAAEQGIKLINLAFIADIPHMKLKIAQAGAGISAWGGALEVQYGRGRVTAKYPPFYAIRQMMGHLAGYQSIERVFHADPHARIYRVRRGGRTFWIAWRDPKAVLLPGDSEPPLTAELAVGGSHVWVEPVITAIGQTTPTRERLSAEGGTVSLSLRHRPIYVLPE